MPFKIFRGKNAAKKATDLASKLFKNFNIFPKINLTQNKKGKGDGIVVSWKKEKNNQNDNK